jgi:hypothetical protein
MTMRTRAPRIAATLAGVAALGVGLAGTAAAAPVADRGHDSYDYAYDSYGADGADGGHSGRADGYHSDRAGEVDETRTPDAVHKNLDGETESPGVHDNGLVAFDTPTVKTMRDR